MRRSHRETAADAALNIAHERQPVCQASSPSPERRSEIDTDVPEHQPPSTESYEPLDPSTSSAFPARPARSHYLSATSPTSADEP
ncbi:hypothetical protein G7Y89_g6313 [Cudoniella acicularis]|uniref:Uncharacterized protein n=1 Tax=Cudoniella acicularis TaxID=354080 RepID=A0A8H4RKS0_9HELO|nr:hypothetical protein G7Y89_g6313 [Cudoniella acicularis]